MTQYFNESLDELNAVLLALYDDTQTQRPDLFLAQAFRQTAAWLGVAPGCLRLRRSGPRPSGRTVSQPRPSASAITHLNPARNTRTDDWLSVDDTGQPVLRTESHNSLDELRCHADHADFSLMISPCPAAGRLSAAAIDGLCYWMPHFVQALRLNQIQYLKRQQGTDETMALVDHNGLIWAHLGTTDVLAAGSVRQAHRLTGSVMADLAGRGEWRGPAVRFEAEPVGPFLLVRANAISVLAQLTPRERDIARLFTRGYSYKEVAMRLSISPATVRNHIARIYSKTDVHNKVALSLLLAG